MNNLFCSMCGTPRSKIEPTVHAISLTRMIPRLRVFAGAPIEADPRMIVSVGLYRNGGGLPGEHLCQSCIRAGIMEARKMIDEALYPMAALSGD